MNKDYKSVYQLLSASLVFIKIALQLCEPKTPIVGVEGPPKTQVNKGFLDENEEVTKLETDKCEEVSDNLKRVRDNSHPKMPTQAGVLPPIEPTLRSNVSLKYSDSNLSEVSHFELIQIFLKIDSGWVPETYGFPKETSKFKQNMAHSLLVLNGTEVRLPLNKDHWTTFVAQIRKSHEKLSPADFEKIDIGLIHFLKRKETSPNLGIGIICCRNIFSVLWVKSITKNFSFKNDRTIALSHSDTEMVAYCGYCPGGDLIKQKPNYILSKSLKREFGEDFGEFQRAKFVKDSNSEGVTLVFVPNEKLQKNIENLGMSFRILGGIRVYLEKHVRKSQLDHSDEDIVAILQQNEETLVKVEI